MEKQRWMYLELAHVYQRRCTSRRWSVYNFQSSPECGRPLKTHGIYLYETEVCRPKNHRNIYCDILPLYALTSLPFGISRSNNIRFCNVGIISNSRCCCKFYNETCFFGVAAIFWRNLERGIFFLIRRAKCDEKKKKNAMKKRLCEFCKKKQFTLLCRTKGQNEILPIKHVFSQL